MKRLLYVLVCMLVICACNRKGNPYEDASDQYQESAQVDSNAYASTNENRHDTLKVQVDTLALSVNHIQERMSNDSTLIAKKLDSKMEGSTIFAIIGAFAILLIFIIVLFVKNKELRSRLNDAESKEANHFTWLNQQVQNLQGQNSGQGGFSLSKRDVDVLNQTLLNYNARLTALEAKEQSRKESHNGQVGHSASPKVERNIYFGVNQGNIFTMELSASDERVAFKGNKISEDKVEFIPISWDRIKSLNSSETVVKIKGSLKGSNMKVLSKGYAVKRVENGKSYWQVMDPVEIQLV
jgi:hypothetical protein